VLCTAEAPDDLIERIADAMHDYSSSRAGTDVVAEVAFQWRKWRLVGKSYRHRNVPNGPDGARIVHAGQPFGALGRLTALPTAEPPGCPP
jgi:hypothetical protein